MKKHIFVLSAALFAAMLSGCGNVEPPSAPEFSEPTRIMPIESSPESVTPSEETGEITESMPDYPVKNEAGYIKTIRNYDQGELISTETKVYDVRGNEVDYHDVTRKDEEVIRERHIVTEYDDRGRISRESEYRIEDGEERPVTISEYEYL